MCRTFLLPVIALALVVSGCVAPTPQDRISKNRSLYEQFPSEVQRKVSAGQVDVGFTPPMVELALGEPTRRYSRTDAGGDSEVWVYQSRKPQFGFGIGFGTGGYGSGVSTGVSMNSRTRGEGEELRVVFQNGRVVSTERTVE